MNTSKNSTALADCASANEDRWHRDLVSQALASAHELHIDLQKYMKQSLACVSLSALGAILLGGLLHSAGMHWIGAVAVGAGSLLLCIWVFSRIADSKRESKRQSAIQSLSTAFSVSRHDAEELLTDCSMLKYEVSQCCKPLSNMSKLPTFAGLFDGYQFVGLGGSYDQASTTLAKLNEFLRLVEMFCSVADESDHPGGIVDAIDFGSDLGTLRAQLDLGKANLKKITSLLAEVSRRHGIHPTDSTPGMNDSVTGKAEPAVHTRSATGDQAEDTDSVDVRTLLQKASESYDAQEFEKAIEFYDAVLDADDLSVNTYMVKEHRAMAYCKAGRFEEAERDLAALLDMIKCKGGRPTSSKVMFWLLVARYKGDESKAMSEFIDL